MKLNTIVYQLIVKDIQDVAQQKLSRKLTLSEINIIKDSISEKINWYDVIADSINEKIDAKNG